MKPHDYELVLVNRGMAQSGAPTFTEVEALNAVPSFSWSRKLSGYGQLSLSFAPEVQSPDVQARLLDLTLPTELWVYRTSAKSGLTELRWAGPVTGMQVQGGTVNLQASELASLLWRMVVEPGDTLSYTATDQHTIAKGLVDYWQALDYGNFGFDTSGVTASGTTRDRTYAGTEAHIIGQRLTELGDVSGGFEWEIDPETRALLLGTPTLGTDTSNSFIIDGRFIANANAVWSAGPADLATAGYAWTGGTAALSGSATNAVLMAQYGRLAAVASANGVTEQATITAKAQGLVDELGDPLYDPSPEIQSHGDCTVCDLALGNTITIEYDYGFGLVSTTRRVVGYQVNVDSTGLEKMSLELV